MKVLFSCVFAMACVGALQAQAPPVAAQKDAIRNGGFERTMQSPNLWSGVDKDGYLAGFRAYLPALSESGNISDSPMPVSVTVDDLNSDGLSDILASDPLGYIRIYFNSGTKEQPKFTVGELILPWLASGEGEALWRPSGLNWQESLAWEQRWSRRRLGGRACLADFSNSGQLDLVLGNYCGDIFLVKNSGSAQAPQFPQPQNLEKALIPTSKDPNHRWGNIFTPVVCDWDGDRKADLILGEGSYSANNVHLLLNQGSATTPSFNEDKRTPLALGEGRQHLAPALADINGDGKIDLLVSDSKGNLTAYIRPASWKFGESISPSGFLAKNGGLSPDPAQAVNLGAGVFTIATGDLNGDGKFDIVAGKSNGRIAWLPNKGTVEAPRFDVPIDLAGTKPDPPLWQLPSQWDLDTGLSRGNFLAYASCVSAQDDTSVQTPEGTRTLKFGYAPAQNKIMPVPGFSARALQKFDRIGARDEGNPLFRASAEQRSIGAPPNYFVLRQPLQLEIGKTYELSFKTKGNKVSNATCVLGWRGFKQLAEDKIIRGERGAVKRQRNYLADGEQQSFEFRPAGSWSTTSKSFRIVFKNERDINKEKFTSEGIIEISFELAAPDGFLYLDDLKLIPSS